MSFFKFPKKPSPSQARTIKPNTDSDSVVHDDHHDHDHRHGEDTAAELYHERQTKSAADAMWVTGMLGGRMATAAETCDTLLYAGGGGDYDDDNDDNDNNDERLVEE
jgi:hypothetical protein